MTSKPPKDKKYFESEEEARRFAADAFKGVDDKGTLIRSSPPARFTDADNIQAMKERARILASLRDSE
jgi:hypothetical protein